MKQWIDATDNCVLERNMAKLKQSHDEQAAIDFANMDKESKMFIQEKKNEGGEKEMNDKKRLEYMLYDLPKVNDQYKKR
jgi:carboxylesterase type B